MTASKDTRPAALDGRTGGIFLYEVRFVNDCYAYFSEKQNAVHWAQAVRRDRKKTFNTAPRKGDHRISLIRATPAQIADLINGCSRGYWHPGTWVPIGVQGYPSAPRVVESFEVPIGRS